MGKLIAWTIILIASIIAGYILFTLFNFSEEDRGINIGYYRYDHYENIIEEDLNILGRYLTESSDYYPKKTKEEVADINKERFLSRLERNNLFKYYYSDDEKEIKNALFKTREDILKKSDYIVFEKNEGQIFTKSVIPNGVDVEYLYSKLELLSEADQTVKIYLELEEKTLNHIKEEYKIRQELLERSVLELIILLLIVFISSIYIVYNDIKRNTEIIIDRIYTEIDIIMLSCTLALPFVLLKEVFTGSFSRSLPSVLLIAVFLMILSLFIALAFLLSLVRKLLNRELLKTSFIYSVFNIFDGRMYKDKPHIKKLSIRQNLYIGVSIASVFFFAVGLLSGAEFIVVLTIIIEMIFTILYLTSNKKTFKDIVSDINTNVSLKNKSESTKTELITNVSHDLKTPLTSIITNLDLLKKEELTEVQRDYLNIIDKKANSLKDIVSDLFELSKSVSGNIELDIKELDFKKLVEQTMVDLDDIIKKSNLNYVLKLPEKEVKIKTDGKKMYRVLQNLIDNTVKYSLENTRVFIKLTEDGTLNIMNTSKYPLDFTPEDVLERFKRGDESRTSEGSGLGLSIAESFTYSCGGRFNLAIDGDLFKVTIKFSTIKE